MLICLDQRDGEGCGTEHPISTSCCGSCGRSLRYAVEVLDPGEVVEKYRIVRLIGHGGFGAVYEAKVIVSGETVALKEAFNAEFMHHFQEEFKVLHALAHPNLPRYDRVFTTNFKGYLVMEFVPGQSLLEILESVSAPLLEKQVLGFALQLCDVLGYLHNQEVPLYHRDIKPANIRLTPSGLIKLVDFGLVKEGQDPTRPSRQGWGTPAYMPLEQVKGQRGRTDACSDIYSVGATLYQLLTNQVPETAVNRFGAEEDGLIAPRQHNGALSEEMSQAILRAMALLPQNRYQSVDELARALHGLPAASVFAGAPTKMTTSTESAKRILFQIKRVLRVLVGRIGVTLVRGSQHVRLWLRQGMQQVGKRVQGRAGMWRALGISWQSWVHRGNQGRQWVVGRGEYLLEALLEGLTGGVVAGLIGGAVGGGGTYCLRLWLHHDLGRLLQDRLQGDTSGLFFLRLSELVQLGIAWVWGAMLNGAIVGMVLGILLALYPATSPLERLSTFWQRVASSFGGAFVGTAFGACLGIGYRLMSWLIAPPMLALSHMPLLDHLLTLPQLPAMEPTLSMELGRWAMIGSMGWSLLGALDGAMGEVMLQQLRQATLPKASLVGIITGAIALGVGSTMLDLLTLWSGQGSDVIIQGTSQWLLLDNLQMCGPFVLVGVLGGIVMGPLLVRLGIRF